MESEHDLAAVVASNDFANVAANEDAIEELSLGCNLNLEVKVVDFLSGYTVHGTLECFTPGEVTILLNESMSEQRLVSVDMGSFVFEGHTLYCRPSQDQFEVHVSIDDIEANGLRRAPRFPVKLPANLFLSKTEPVAITIVDISSDGLGIELTVSVQPGQPIAVATESVMVFATVRHCRQLPEGTFRAGAEMHHLFQKSIESLKDNPRSNLLQRVLGQQFRKGVGLTLAWR
jgi:hypothetical protein